MENEKLKKAMLRKLADSECSLGSVQYDAIGATVAWAYPLIEEDEKAFEEAMGITYTRRLSIKDLEEDLATVVLDYLKELADDEEDLRRPLLEPEEREVVRKAESGRLPVSDFLEFAANSSWDLWSAMPEPLVGIRFEAPLLIPPLGPFGKEPSPPSDNFILGIQMAYTIKYVEKETDTILGFDEFSGFDT